jgi:hypothetical protein
MTAKQEDRVVIFLQMKDRRIETGQVMHLIFGIKKNTRKAIVEKKDAPLDLFFS